jgi:chitosanase
MITALQKNTAQAIVNIFETGSALGDYGNVTLVSGDSGHLTYGRSQTTLASGNLFLLIKAYTSAEGAQFTDLLRPYLSRLRQLDLSLDNDSEFRDLLRQAGSDLVMHDVQDSFFDRVYWQPAATAAAQLTITSALGCCVVYDSKLHGHWVTIRDRTNAQFGTPDRITEKGWIPHYISVRREWLAKNPKLLLRRTVYRMDVLGTIAASANWQLDLPIVVRGIRIDETVLAGPPLRVSAQTIEERLLLLRDPMMQGDDVRSVQQALNDHGARLEIDAIYGPATATAVSEFQRQNGLTVDGIVGPSTRAALSLTLRDTVTLQRS